MNEKRKMIIGVIALVVISMVGYALFSETINIKGTAKGEGNLSLIINPIEQNSVEKYGDVKLNKLENNGKKLSIDVSFGYPGSSISIPLSIKNNGTIPAVLRSVPKAEGLLDEKTWIDINSSNDGYKNAPDLLIALLSLNDYKYGEYGPSIVDKNHKNNTIFSPGEIRDLYLMVGWNQESKKSNFNLNIDVQLDYEQIVNEMAYKGQKFCLNNDKECFFAIKDNGNTVTALAEKNITTDTHIQSDNTQNISFSNTDYWIDENNCPTQNDGRSYCYPLAKYGKTELIKNAYGRYMYNPPISVLDKESLIWPHLQEYKKYLSGFSTNIINIRLIKLDEFFEISNAPWITSGNSGECYWTEDVDAYLNVPLAVCSSDSLAGGTGGKYMIRPVIEINKSEIHF